MILLPTILTFLMIGQCLVNAAEVCKKEECERCCSVTDARPQGNYTLPREYAAYPCIELAYKVHLDTYKNSTEAESICQSEGGHLAVIDSELKLKYALRPPIPRFLGKRHVGIRLSDDKWVSIVNGSIVKNIPWAQNNPYYNHDKHCTAISHAISSRRIMTVKCKDFGDFVCQIPLPEICPENKVEVVKLCLECNAYSMDPDCQ